MDKKQTIHDILTQREDFIVIGLTGRMGSGCSRVAEVLATPFDEMKFPKPIPQSGLHSLSEEERIIRIVAEYAEMHWQKFDVIQAGAVIAAFIFADDRRFMSDLEYRANRSNKTHKVDFKKEWLNRVYRNVALLYSNSCSPQSEVKKYIVEPENDKERAELKASEAHYEISPDCFAYRELFGNEYVTNRMEELRKLEDQLKRLIGTDDGLEYYFGVDYKCNYKVLFGGQTEVQEDSGQAGESPAGGGKPSSSKWERIGEMMNYLYRQVPQKHPEIHRRKFLECVDRLLVIFSVHCLMDLLNHVMKEDDAANALWNRLKEINQKIEPNIAPDSDVLQVQKFVFVKYITPWFGRFIREYVTDSLGDGAYARLFQRYGQMIRYYSCIPAYKDEETATQAETQKNKDGGKKEDIFAIPRKINQYIKILRHPFCDKEHRPVCIVVDSIKNVFEAVYLRYRYSAFYLWAITTDSNIRERRLRDKHLTDIQVRMMDWNEYPDKGSKVIQKAESIVSNLSRGNTEKEDKKGGEMTPRPSRDQIRTEIINKLGSAEADFYLDSLDNISLGKDEDTEAEARRRYFDENEIFNKKRREFFQDNTYVFYTQDIDSCVCNADVYLFNNATGITDVVNNRKLLEDVVRNVSLVMYPCLVRPTPIERCMQIALSAKVNSGCLSRQVGAVVTDSQYNILSIGWNDVPCGEVPCAYKNLTDIIVSADRDAYSEYELHNSDFRDRLKKIKVDAEDLRGLPFSYCFKDIHKDTKDPMRSRAMHAEEKALALCGREAEGGYLFTTSSPCEMCSKNAKNHKIKKIYYLEAYPGISQAQYTNSGDKDNRAELILFSGAIGRAYMQMYTPLLPHKDVLDHLGIIMK